MAWSRQVAPAVRWASLVCFLFFLVGRDPLRTRSFSTHLPAYQRVGQVGTKHARDYSFSISGGERRLLADVGEKGQVEDGLDNRGSIFSDARRGIEVTPANESTGMVGVVESVKEEEKPQVCEHVKQHVGFRDSCSYVKSIPQCKSGTLIEYVEVFYCTFADWPGLGYTCLVVFLVGLFYMLGNTAADFFCCAIEKLTKLLHLPPTVAGVTLLPLGNGAPDVFASIAAFVGASGQGQVGLNAVLGGATFISSVVVGSVSLVIAAAGAPVNLSRQCFLRDIGFFLVALAALTTILYTGRIYIWGAIAYLSIYAVYAVTVAAVELCKTQRRKFPQYALEPLLTGRDRSVLSPLNEDELGFDSQGPNVECLDNRAGVSSAAETLPQWTWAPHVAMYSHQSPLDRQESIVDRPLWGWTEDQPTGEPTFLRKLCSWLIEWPLSIPRRLTIPLVEEQGWSKFYAVCSATFAPTLLAMVWDGRDRRPVGSAWKEYFVASCIGLTLGGIALFKLRIDRPPRRYLLPWAAGGFVMSVVWFYIVANELVAALVALGVVLEIDPAILGLTVLAWGNSVGDLMSNLALVYHGEERVQIAFSGCYAGPMFNTLIGVGLSLLLESWSAYPASFEIPSDDSLFITLAFLVAGIIWALCMLPSRGMQPTKTFGTGLLILYITFLGVRLARALELHPLFGIR